MSTNPRKLCREILESLVPPALWKQNDAFVAELKQDIEKHRLATHPIIEALEAGRFAEETLRPLHLEFRHAFAQNFTDALIQTMVTAGQLEKTQGALGKTAARFMIQLNVLDELGYQPNADAGSDYAGDPRNAHYVLFDKVLADLGLTHDEVQKYVPSDAAVAARNAVDSVRHDHLLLSTTLATAETIFSRFAGPWARSVSVATTKVDTEAGYHAIHVEHDGEFVDDDHSEDMWFVLRQALETARYPEARAAVKRALDAWALFCDSLLRLSAIAA